MKRDLVKLALLGVVLAIAGFAFAWSGLFNIAASSGHWAITEWFLHFTMRQSVETHAMGIETPPLDDPALVAKGAGHFEAGCAPCHGTPGHRPNPVAKGMTPTPPHLVERVASWEPSELFWIVKNGVKYTGMPAWPALHRDDEAWAMTAFLLRLPDLDPQAYQRLAFGDAGDLGDLGDPGDGGDAGRPNDTFADTVAYCARCHGEPARVAASARFPFSPASPNPICSPPWRATPAERGRAASWNWRSPASTTPMLPALARHYAAMGGNVGLGASCRQGADARPDDAALIETGRKIATGRGAGSGHTALCVLPRTGGHPAASAVPEIGGTVPGLPGAPVAAVSRGGSRRKPL